MFPIVYYIIMIQGLRTSFPLTSRGFLHLSERTQKGKLSKPRTVPRRIGPSPGQPAVETPKETPKNPQIQHMGAHTVTGVRT